MRRTIRNGMGRAWPWLALALVASGAIWHDVDFDQEPDGEYPAVVRPVFSARPPAAYRLAEPGDTIDRIAIYLACAATVTSAFGWLRSRRAGSSGLWPTAFALSSAAAWYAATPGPTFDGWHGMGWRAMFDPKAPATLRWSLAGAAGVLALRGAWPVLAGWSRRGEFFRRVREARCGAILIIAALLVIGRQFEVPGVEPVGYWPRWSLVGGLVLWLAALVRLAPMGGLRLRARGAVVAAGTVAWAGLVAGGITLTWYHRPLERFKEVVPGRIYISAMPTYRGLDIAHERHHFKTIVNLFPEDTPLRSPLWPQEVKWVADHNVRYFRSPNGARNSDRFLDTTLALAQDPESWPMLVHCHGCMDRTPAWVGIYRFVVEGKPLDGIMREIERHRGYRPKASVTMLYNRVLPPRAPRRYAADPTARLLKRCAAGTKDPFDDQLRAEMEHERLASRANQSLPESVVTPTRPSKQGDRRPFP